MMAAEELTQDIATESKQKGSWRSNLPWFGLAMLLLVVFTVIKFPQTRLRNYVQGAVQNALVPYGLKFSAENSSISLGTGISYSLEKVRLISTKNNQVIELDEMTLSPRIMPLLTGTQSAQAWIKKGNGELDLDLSLSGNTAAVDYDADDVDLGELKLLKTFAGVDGAAVASGSGNLEAVLNDPTQLEGDVRLDLEKIAIQSQSVMGFAIPAIKVKKGRVRMAFENGKALVQSLKLGEKGNSEDDLWLEASGDIELKPNLNSSRLNLSAEFTLSDRLIQKLGFLANLLKPGQKKDGTYSYTIGGTVGLPLPRPNPGS